MQVCGVHLSSATSRWRESWPPFGGSYECAGHSCCIFGSQRPLCRVQCCQVPRSTRNVAHLQKEDEYSCVDRSTSYLHVQTLRNFPVEKLYGEVILVRLDSVLLLDPLGLCSLSLKRTLSTIKYLYKAGGKVLLVTSWDPVLQSVNPVLKSTESFADYMSSLLQVKVIPVNGVPCLTSLKKEEWVQNDITLFENLLNFRGENANCNDFSQKLASRAAIFVNDSFSLSHKIRASTVGITRFCYTSLAGFHFEEELTQLLKINDTTRRPYIAIRMIRAALLVLFYTIMEQKAWCYVKIWINFWKDRWMPELVSTSHPRLFSYAKDEDCSVQKLLTAPTLGSCFYLPLSNPAVRELVSLQQETSEVELNAESRDVWSCVWGTQEFRASKFYRYCFWEEQADEAFQWVWKTRCNNKWKVFGWLLLADRLNTRNMLRRKSMILQGNTYSCLFCTSPPEETLEHVFFWCEFSARCWEKLHIWWPNSGNRLHLVHAARDEWRNPMFMEVFIVAAWGIWKERNNKYFRGVPPSVDSWVERFKTDFELLRHRSKPTLHPFILQFVASP